jgi:hypothetical protein
MDNENTLPTNDLARLRAFQRQTDWMRRSRLMQAKNVKFSLSLNFVPKKNPIWQFEGFEKEHFLAVLPVFRQFVLNDEPVHLYSIHNIIMRYCNRQEIKAWVAYARREWKETLEAMPNSILYAFTQFKSLDEIVQKYFYGFGGLFHLDLETEANPLQSEEVMLAAVQKAFPRLWRCILNVDSSITLWLDKPNEPVPDLSI